MRKEREKEGGVHHRKGYWYVSPYNFVKKGRIGAVEIHDVTLRDGEESSGVVFTKDAKIAISKALDALGVRRIEMGLTIAPPDESLKAVRAVVDLGLEARIFAVYAATQRREGVDMALRSNVEDVVIGFLPVSDISIKNILGKSREWVEETFVKAISYAKDHGLRVTFFPPDGTRTDLDFLRHLMKVCVETAHADSVVLVDSYGVATPEAIAYMTRALMKEVKVPLEIHTHNDFGLGLANAIAAIREGASVIHTSVNGLGFRCGNPPTEEVVMALIALYGIDLGIDLRKLTETSRLVAELSRQPFGHNKPIVGKGGFTFERSGGLSGYLERGLIHLGLPFNPEVVGRKIEVILSKWSDMSTIEGKIREMGYSATGEETGRILGIVTKSSMSLGRPISETEFKEIVTKVIKKRLE